MPKRKNPSDFPEPHQSCNWAFTFNNYREDEVETIKEMAGDGRPYKRIRFQREVGDSGTPHLQGYVIFDKKRTRASVQKLLASTRPTQLHCRPCYADVDKNEVYCTKQGGTDVYEDGVVVDECPGEAVAKTANERAEVVLALAEKGDWDTLRQEHPAVYLYNKSQLTRAFSDALEAPDVLDGVLDNTWVYGAAGVGKDKYANKMVKAPFIKSGTHKWWTGYAGQQHVIMRDVDRSITAFAGEFKLWTDRYKFDAETKGGNMRIRPVRIVVTSNYSPSQLFSGEDLAAVLRRFQLVHVRDGKAHKLPRVNVDNVDTPVSTDDEFDEEDM